MTTAKDDHRSSSSSSAESAESGESAGPVSTVHTGAASSAAISTISGSIAARSSQEGFANKGLSTSDSATPTSTPTSTLKKKSSASVEYMETEGL